MTRLEKATTETEISEFKKKFLDKKKSYIISYDVNGNIISIDTTDKEILEHISKLGLK
jgi:hypothetical protein